MRRWRWRWRGVGAALVVAWALIGLLPAERAGASLEDTSALLAAVDAGSFGAVYSPLDFWRERLRARRASRGATRPPPLIEQFFAIEVELELLPTLIVRLSADGISVRQRPVRGPGVPAAWVDPLARPDPRAYRLPPDQTIAQAGIAEASEIQVPEPGTGLLIAAGLAWALLRSRRRSGAHGL